MIVAHPFPDVYLVRAPPLAERTRSAYADLDGHALADTALPRPERVLAAAPLGDDRAVFLLSNWHLELWGRDERGEFGLRAPSRFWFRGKGKRHTDPQSFWLGMDRQFVVASRIDSVQGMELGCVAYMDPLTLRIERECEFNMWRRRLVGGRLLNYHSEPWTIEDPLVGAAAPLETATVGGRPLGDCFPLRGGLADDGSIVLTVATQPDEGNQVHLVYEQPAREPTPVGTMWDRLRLFGRTWLKEKIGRDPPLRFEIGTAGSAPVAGELLHGAMRPVRNVREYLGLTDDGEHLILSRKDLRLKKVAASLRALFRGEAATARSAHSALEFLPRPSEKEPLPEFVLRNFVCEDADARERLYAMSGENEWAALSGRVRLA